MKKNRNVFKLLIILAGMVLAGAQPAASQSPMADSAFYWLQKSLQGSAVDTVAFEKGTTVIIKLTTLPDSLIRQFEEKVGSFPRGEEEYWRYRILFSILINLSTSDMDRAITYGKRIYGEAEKLKGPHAAWIRSTLLKQLRLPFRNSGQISEIGRAHV